MMSIINSSYKFSNHIIKNYIKNPKFPSPDVTYHNNTSERALRPITILRKITYGSRSMRGTKTTEILMTIYATCEARGINPYKFMIDYLN